MIRNIFQWHSLKTRLTILTLAVFVGGIVIQAIYLSRSLRIDIERQLSEQQFAAVSFVAAVVNDDLRERMSALELIAGGIDESLLAQPVALQKYLENRRPLADLFNAGVFVVGKNGIALADYPRMAGRIGTNYSDREHVAVALQGSQTRVGKPVPGRVLHGAPSLPISTPIHDRQGRVIGGLVGATDLSQPNFLDKITYGRSGKTGGYLVIARQWRLIITAGEKRFVMAPLLGVGAIPLIDRFIDGYEGSGVLVNQLGEERLASTKGVPLANWYVTNSMPTSEAFLPIRNMQFHILLTTIILSLLAAVLILLLIKRELAPVFETIKTLSRLSSENLPMQQLPQVTRQNEIGDLIGSFNLLIGKVADREQSLRTSEARSRAIAQSANEAIITSDSAGNIVGWNHGAEITFGYLESEALGQPMTLLIPERYRDAHVAGMSRARLGAEHRIIGKTVELSGLRKDGSEFPLELSLAKWESNDGVFFTGILRDITGRKYLEEQVNRMAFYDELTKLANRRLLKDRIMQSIAASKRNGRYGALIFLDLDNFKSLNDSEGHAVGDLLLIEVANRLKSCVREVDTVARFGGDEFVVLINELSADKSESATQANVVAEKIRAAIGTPYVLQVPREGEEDATVDHQCTASIGVVFFSQKETGQEDVLRRADAAMYLAKKAGRNSIQVDDIADT